jgi:hypothetical protein
VLAKHGPLSMGVMSQLLPRPMKTKKLYTALMRLRKKGMVDRRVSNMGMGTAFYQLSQRFIDQPGLSETLDCDPAELTRLRNIRACLHQREVMELWLFLLAKVLPVVEVVRREQFATHAETNALLQVDKNPLLHFPDAVIYMLGLDDQKLAVALEIEKTRQSGERIVEYLKRYSKATGLNGIIYACDSGRLSDTIRLIREATKTDKRFAEAVDSKSFFLFSNADSHVDAPLSQLHTVTGQPTKIVDWYSQHRITEPTICSEAILN